MDMGLNDEKIMHLGFRGIFRSSKSKRDIEAMCSNRKVSGLWLGAEVYSVNKSLELDSTKENIRIEEEGERFVKKYFRELPLEYGKQCLFEAYWNGTGNFELNITLSFYEYRKKKWRGIGMSLENVGIEKYELVQKAIWDWHASNVFKFESTYLDLDNYSWLVD